MKNKSRTLLYMQRVQFNIFNISYSSFGGISESIVSEVKCNYRSRNQCIYSHVENHGSEKLLMLEITWKSELHLNAAQGMIGRIFVSSQRQLLKTLNGWVLEHCGLDIQCQDCQTALEEDRKDYVFTCSKQRDSFEGQGEFYQLQDEYKRTK